MAPGDSRPEAARKAKRAVFPWKDHPFPSGEGGIRTVGPARHPRFGRRAGSKPLAAELDAVFIADGIHGEDIRELTPAAIEKLCNESGVFTIAAIRALVW